MYSNQHTKMGRSGSALNLDIFRLKRVRLLDRWVFGRYTLKQGLYGIEFGSAWGIDHFNPYQFELRRSMNYGY